MYLVLRLIHFLFGLLLTAFISFKGRLQQSARAFGGGEGLPDLSLPPDNPYRNDNQLFRKLAGLASSGPDCGHVDFNALRSGKQEEIHFHEPALEIENLYMLSEEPSVPNQWTRTGKVFPALSKQQEGLTHRQLSIIEGVLVDLSRAMFPSLSGLPIKLNDLLLVITIHLARYFKNGAYSSEFFELLGMLSFFEPHKSASFCQKILYSHNEWPNADELTKFALENDCTFTLWWIIEAGHLHSLNEDVIAFIFKQTHINRRGALTRIIQIHSVAYPIPDTKSDSAPWPLLWFIGMRAASDFDLIQLLDDILEVGEFTWDSVDSNSCTILGRWIKGGDGYEIPSILISTLLRRKVINTYLAVLKPEPLNVVQFVGVLSETEQRYETQKLFQYLLEADIFNWESVVLNALESGQLWMFFHLLNSALYRCQLSKRFVEEELIGRLQDEVYEPGELSAKFKASHEGLLTQLSGGEVSSSPSVVFNYHSGWKTEKEEVLLESSSESVGQSWGWLSRNRSRSHSSHSRKIRIVPVSVTENVLATVREIMQNHFEVLPIKDKQEEELIKRGLVDAEKRF